MNVSATMARQEDWILVFTGGFLDKGDFTKN
jgi:hypothetical protein